MSNYLDNLVKCFNNSSIGVNLTTVLIDNEPWFIAKEVASLLGYSDLKKAIRDHIDDEDQKMLSYSECKELFGTLSLINEDIEYQETVGSEEDLKGDKTSPLNGDTVISNFGMKLINESGLYTLITSSKKREAKPFRRWVTSEVLPSIRNCWERWESQNEQNVQFEKLNEYKQSRYSKYRNC